MYQKQRRRKYSLEELDRRVDYVDRDTGLEDVVDEQIDRKLECEIIEGRLREIVD